MTLGIETLGGVREPLIERNTTIPTSKSKTFTTAADNQTAVTIHIVQGERPMAQDNVSLGSFNLSDLPPAPRGVPQIEVKFDIDANGIINVTATDTATKKEAKITIESKTKLTEDEINKLKEDAEKYADADKNKKEQVEIKNEAESFIYTTEKLIGGDLKDKISQKQGIDLTDLIKELREAMTANNNDAMKEKLEALKKQVGEITAEIYKNALEKTLIQNLEKTLLVIQNLEKTLLVIQNLMKHLKKAPKKKQNHPVQIRIPQRIQVALPDNM